MVEKMLQRTRGKGTVIDVQQRCDRYTAEHVVDQERTTPFWFCYDCSEFLCHHCEREMHQREREGVSSSLEPQTFPELIILCRESAMLTGYYNISLLFKSCQLCLRLCNLNTLVYYACNTHEVLNVMH